MVKVTVFKHKGFEIKINPLEPKSGYTIEHPDFEGRVYNLAQDAVDAIDAAKGHWNNA